MRVCASDLSKFQIAFNVNVIMIRWLLNISLYSITILATARLVNPQPVIWMTLIGGVVDANTRG